MKKNLFKTTLLMFGFLLTEQLLAKDYTDADVEERCEKLFKIMMHKTDWANDRGFDMTSRTAVEEGATAAAVYIALKCDERRIRPKN